MTTRNEITAGLWLQYTWFHHDGPNPLTWLSADEWEAHKREEAAAWQSLAEEVRSVAPTLDASMNALHSRFGTPALVREQRAQQAAIPRSGWPEWLEPRLVIAIALGAPEPTWMNNLWWHDRTHYPLEHIETVAELARLPIPDWPGVEIVQRMLERMACWQRERPHDPPARLAQIYDNLVVPGQGEIASICYPSYVDLGLHLMGATRFFEVLAGEPELGDAFLDFCFELSTSYTDFLLSLRPEPFVGLLGFGGDATFFLSPPLYARYGAAFDARLFDYVRARYNMPAAMPCNLHSCGASAHLYAHWAQHPCRENITCMQTRLIPGTVGRLRAALPATQLELTLHQPQFNLADAEPPAIRAIIRESAIEAGGCNCSFGFIVGIHRPEDLPRLTRNLAVVLEEMEALYQL